MEMFTKRHYEAIAKSFAETRPREGTIRWNGNREQWERDIVRLSIMFLQDNPNFNVGKFRVACGWAEAD